MEIVTLVHAKFNRLGSAQGGGGFSSHSSLEVTAEIAEGSHDALREFIISVADKNGDSREALNDLAIAQNWGQSHQPVVFDIQGRNTRYSSVYAECHTYPALKVGERYFKLQEVKL